MKKEILTLTKTDFLLSYIAGFFDGEGSVGIYSSGNTMSNCCLRVQLKQNESFEVSRIFDFLYQNYGGFTSKTQTYKKKICLTWAASGDKAVKFLRDIYDFSLIKKKQIILCIQWQEGREIIQRDKNGRIIKKKSSEIERDIEYSNQIRRLKDSALGKEYIPLKGDTSSKGCARNKLQI